MKIKILLSITLFVAQITSAQILYSENFENYALGNFTADYTGTVPANGGWYTKTIGTGPHTLNDYKIISDPVKNNVLQMMEPIQKSYSGYTTVYRSDLKTFWQQRNPENNILKLSFDFHTGENTNIGDLSLSFSIGIYNNIELLTSFKYYNNLASEGRFCVAVNRGVTSHHLSHKSENKKLPADTWVTVEIYIDYLNSKIYFSVPSLNYTIVQNSGFPLFLSGNPNHDDNPAKIEIWSNYEQNRPLYQAQIDNIVLSAQNTVPKLSVNDVITSKFNVFPNPVNDIVTITNNENIEIEEMLLYDVNGKIIKTINNKYSNKAQINIKNLSAGIYFLHIKTSEGIGIKKIIKN